MKIELFYDKECPFCSSYANYIKLKEKHQLILFNARESSTQIEKFKLNGFDINNGFIIRIDHKEIYQGVDAICFLNDLARKKIFFPNNSFFRKVVYPIIKFFRRVILFLTFKKIDI